MTSAAQPAPRWLRYADARPDPAVLERLRPASAALPSDVLAGALAIVEAVEARGDAALVEFTRRFDGVSLTPDALRVEAATIAASAERAPDALRASLRLAAERVRAFHLAQRAPDRELGDPTGTRLRLLHRPVASAGLYVPGGRAAYPSSVLMNVIPAQVAGVPRIAVFTVPGTIEANPAVAWALQHLGVDEVYRVGGAQAIAAAACGTETIPAVDVITGPGNAWVAAAKRHVYGRVGIDSIAGPSEVLILADESVPPAWVALDLLAQAEHDPLARCVVASTSAPVLAAVLDALEDAIRQSPRREIVEAAWRDHGLALLAESTEDLIALSHRMAPEHLQICLDPLPDVERFLGAAIFVGAHAPTALGDYIVGTNHVLPTGGSARFAGPLGVQTFLRAFSIVEVSADTASGLAPLGATLADHERLPGHAAALRARQKPEPATEGETAPPSRGTP